MRNIIVVLLLLGIASSPHVNARALAADPADPKHILCGASDGRVYSSEDGGESWALFADLGTWNVVSRIVFTDDSILVGTWNPFDFSKGSVWRYRQGKWDRPYIGSAVRAIALDRNLIVVGTLSGVLASHDDGGTWSQIGDIKNVDSVALDGDDIYVGTWHLAYKSPDMGRTWHMIDHGVVNDSDVMSILADDGVVYLSACSGVFRSNDAGSQFSKLKGIPNSSRRTHVLAWQNDNTVYAGTTEGLWKTVDGGASWLRITGDGVVVNDILITHDGVLLAVDRDGVLLVK